MWFFYFAWSLYGIAQHEEVIKPKICVIFSVRSANQTKVNVFERSFTVEYIWQNHVTSSSLQRIMAVLEEDSIIQAPVSYTWNKLDQTGTTVCKEYM